MTLAAIVTAYDELGTLAAATAAAYTTLLALGARPAYPVNAGNDASYNNVTTAIATYDAAYTTDNAAYLTALAAQKVQEAVVTALMPKNQWLTVAGLANWGAAATQYISYPAVQSTSPNSCPIYSIMSVSTLPGRAYPSLT